ncbi:YicC/YloC family endoribonuclease [Pseudomonas sp. F1_0610]|uniref:YicC/YloC family endoribonuclease n=1 Tax=Pseudomonas sp. F1_0610 TaxID=3114284 RepID=UPI0039C491C6
MAHSMTAFARIERAEAFGTLSWEIRSVNHRYLEPNLRLPENFRDLEGNIREIIRKELSRGKLECTLRFTEANDNQSLQINKERATQIIQAAESIAQLMQKPSNISPMQVLAYPGVLIADNLDPQLLSQSALAGFKEAISELKNGRAREGQELCTIMLERLASMQTEVETIRNLVPEMLENQRQKILTRCEEMKVEIDPQRLEQEMVLLAQKSDIAEEIDRLCTHISEVRRVLQSQGAIGRRLDFLMQELNREANTLGSKAFDSRSTQTAVNLKVLIEQMREQVQNIE